jgi:hypothetical protein
MFLGRVRIAHVVTSMLLLAAVPALSGGCGGGGACVTSTVISEYCIEDDDATFCDSTEGVFHEGDSCADLGFTKECPNEPGSYRRPDYGC